MIELSLYSLFIDDCLLINVLCHVSINTFHLNKWSIDDIKRNKKVPLPLSTAIHFEKRSISSLIQCLFLRHNIDKN